MKNEYFLMSGLCGGMWSFCMNIVVVVLGGIHHDVLCIVLLLYFTMIN